jgi:regulator of sigma E protease
MKGDRILSVGGRGVDTWEDLEVAVGMRRANREVSLVFQRDGRTVETKVWPVSEGRYEMGTIGVYPDVHPNVVSVIADDRADQAGIKAGDIIVAVDGQWIYRQPQLIEVISRSGGKPLQWTIRRGNQELTLKGTPEQQGSRGMMGFYLDEPSKSFKPGPLESLKLSVQQNIESSGLIFRTLAGLFTGETSVRQLQGPVGIAQLSGESAERGFLTLLSLMAMLSINLGILNLMPVPVLDGGHILIMALEGIARRDFSMQVKEKMLLAGFVVLMMLMVTVIYNDLTRISWIERLMPWRN